MGDHKNVFAMKYGHDLHEEIHSGLENRIRLLGSLGPIPILAQHKLLGRLTGLENLYRLALVTNVSTPTALDQEIRDLGCLTGDFVQQNLGGLKATGEWRGKHLVPLRHFRRHSIGQVLDLNPTMRRQRSVSMSRVHIR